jgi:DNA-binding transcriptional ArsR family regulator
MPDKGQDKETRVSKNHEVGSRISDFVLDKVIFSNVFEKDIRRIYIYRKAERLAKAIQLITPAFATAPSLRNRLDGIAVGLIDAAILPPSSAREALSRELLALSSILSVARTGSLISDMNADLITREAHLLLQEIAGYEEPRLFMEESLSLAELAKRAPDMREVGPAAHATSGGVRSLQKPSVPEPMSSRTDSNKGHFVSDKGQIKDNLSNDSAYSSRQNAILEILRSKGPSYIKDISMLIREVSEKTIQRELQALLALGAVKKEGERRWTQYFLT